jgi:glycosyltransferase involved in cell wall biosynthesis
MPFAIVEGICCGVVPVSTRVGTIDEVIVDGETGFLVPPRNARALAAALNRLLDDPDLYVRLRAKVLEQRSAYDDGRAMAAWGPWLAWLSGGADGAGARAAFGSERNSCPREGTC